MSVYSIGSGFKKIEDDVPVGTWVAYEDMANPYHEAVVVGGGDGRYGSRCIFTDNYTVSEVSSVVLGGPGGWRRVDKPLASAEKIAELESLHEATMKKLTWERKRREEEREKAEAEGKKKFEERKPAWAKAMIVAVREVDKSDIMTDYFASEDAEMVVLAWSKHTRDLFPEMRKAAGLFDKTAHLVNADSDAEHREKWSMGAGFYLKDGSRYSNGWKVEKRNLRYGVNYEWMASENAWLGLRHKVEDKKEEDETTGKVLAVDATESGAIIGEFKGHETLSIPLNGSGKMFTFGKVKAKAILDYFEDIKKFAEGEE